jgi:hypothetical protein
MSGASAMSTTGSSLGHGRMGSLIRQPRLVLFLLAGWSLLALLSQVLVNSGLFLDIHDIELDGALGGLALSFNAAPLAVLYIYCARDHKKFSTVFWLALVQQGAMFTASLYQLAIGTFSFESVVVPLFGSAALAVLSFLQVFERKPARV